MGGTDRCPSRELLLAVTCAVRCLPPPPPALRYADNSSVRRAAPIHPWHWHCALAPASSRPGCILAWYDHGKRRDTSSITSLFETRGVSCTCALCVYAALHPGQISNTLAAAGGHFSFGSTGPRSSISQPTPSPGPAAYFHPEVELKTGLGVCVRWRAPACLLRRWSTAVRVSEHAADPVPVVCL